MTRTRASAKSAGFTLVEMLVTMTLLALIVVVLFGGLQFGARVWEGAQAHGAGTEELRIVQNLIRREIEQAYPYYDTSDPIHPVVDFRGGADWVVFQAAPPQATGTAGHDRITLRTEYAGSSARLVISGMPSARAARRSAWSAVLLSNVRSLRISYLAAGGWAASWGDAKTMPPLVRIQVTFPPGDGRVWPDLIVAPRINTDAACDYDVSTNRCRGRV